MKEHHIDLKEVEKDVLGSADEHAPPPKNTWQSKQMGWCGWLFSCTLPKALPCQQPITDKEKQEIKHRWSQHILEAETAVTDM